jgi:hypothetical protein
MHKASLQKSKINKKYNYDIIKPKISTVSKELLLTKDA